MTTENKPNLGWVRDDRDIEARERLCSGRDWWEHALPNSKLARPSGANPPSAPSRASEQEKRDAKYASRYRWLRATNGHAFVGFNEKPGFKPCGSMLDDYIDAYMEAPIQADESRQTAAPSPTVAGLTDEAALRVALEIMEKLDDRSGVLDEVDDETRQEIADEIAFTIKTRAFPADSESADAIRNAWEGGQALQRAIDRLPSDSAETRPVLKVFYGPMPESNGKSNFTAILYRDSIFDGITIERSEYPDRVRYEADRMRWMIGEIAAEPDIMAYDADKHSGYAAPASTRAQGAVTDEHEAFERAFSHLSLRNYMEDGLSAYWHPKTQGAWEGWQARAILAAPAQGAKHAECERCGHPQQEHAGTHWCDNQSFGVAEGAQGSDARDAARYRWLRDSDRLPAEDDADNEIVVGNLGGESLLWTEQLDAAIDAAMSREQPTEQQKGGE